MWTQRLSYWYLIICVYLNAIYVTMKQTYDRHPFAYVVEVKNGEQTVGDGSPHLRGGYRSRRAGAKHKAEVSSRRHQSALVWRLSLVNQLSW